MGCRFFLFGRQVFVRVDLVCKIWVSLSLLVAEGGREGGRGELFSAVIQKTLKKIFIVRLQLCMVDPVCLIDFVCFWKVSVQDCRTSNISFLSGATANSMLDPWIGRFKQKTKGRSIETQAEAFTGTRQKEETSRLRQTGFYKQNWFDSQGEQPLDFLITSNWGVWRRRFRVLQLFLGLLKGICSLGLKNQIQELWWNWQW